MPRVPTGCVECDGPIAHRMGDGCPVCEKHWQEYQRGARIACRYTALMGVVG